MAEPQQKKIYLDKLEQFRLNESLVKLLSETVWRLGTSLYGFRLLQIQWCNAHKGVSFSDAFVECTSNADDTFYLFDCIFQRGFMVMRSFIENKELPTGKGELKALELLLEFLTDIKECEKALKEPWQNKTEWTVRVAHHLLSKLAVNPNYVIGNHSPYFTWDCHCCSRAISGKFGDTSIGNTQVWHGYLDILIDPVAVNVPEKKPESPSGNEVYLDINKNQHLVYNRSQVIAQTIVSSFLTKKRHPEYSNFLVPSIVIKSTEAIVFFYDCENDILLQSCPLRLFADSGELHWYTVFALWLTINFKYLCSGTPKKVKELDYRADFFKFIEPISNIYEDVKIGCGSRERLVEDFYPHLSCFRPVGMDD